MTVQTTAAEPADGRDLVLLRGRVALVYALSQQYLSLPFAVLCMVAALLRPSTLLWSAIPFIGHIAARVYGNRLKTAYDNRTVDDPRIWALRYTILSGIVGGIWGIGAVVWFDFTSFAAQAYLVLAFLGLSATEFIPRAVPARLLAHATGSLVPLSIMLWGHPKPSPSFW